MAERFQDTPDRKAQALAERVFSLVEGYQRRIIQARTEQERDGYTAQISGELKKVRRYIVGDGQRKLTPALLHRLTGEYALKTTHLEEAVLESEVAEAPASVGLDTLRTATLSIPKTKAGAIQLRMGQYLGKLQGISEARGKGLDPAFLVFFFDAGGKRMAMPNFNADEWYGEVMSGNSSIYRKIALPIVVIDQIEKAAREGAKAMPNHDRFMEQRHRALNALDELIELWSKDLPAVADKYQMVKDALDHELMTLSLYHRYEQ